MKTAADSFALKIARIFAGPRKWPFWATEVLCLFGLLQMAPAAISVYTGILFGEKRGEPRGHYWEFLIGSVLFGLLFFLLGYWLFGKRRNR